MPPFLQRPFPREQKDQVVFGRELREAHPEQRSGSGGPRQRPEVRLAGASSMTWVSPYNKSPVRSQRRPYSGIVTEPGGGHKRIPNPGPEEWTIPPASANR